ncbi:hypothetical protein BH11PSE11_BH11PSE11_28280 [soil metagenome]
MLWLDAAFMPCVRVELCSGWFADRVLTLYAASNGVGHCKLIIEFRSWLTSSYDLYFYQGSRSMGAE